MARKQYVNVMSHINSVGEDTDFEPLPTKANKTAMPGSDEKIGVMAKRALLGQHIFHKDDPTSYEDLDK